MIGSDGEGEEKEFGDVGRGSSDLLEEVGGRGSNLDGGRLPLLLLLLLPLALTPMLLLISAARAVRQFT